MVVTDKCVLTATSMSSKNIQPCSNQFVTLKYGLSVETLVETSAKTSIEISNYFQVETSIEFSILFKYFGNFIFWGRRMYLFLFPSYWFSPDFPQQQKNQLTKAFVISCSNCLSRRCNTEPTFMQNTREYTQRDRIHNSTYSDAVWIRAWSSPLAFSNAPAQTTNTHTSHSNGISSNRNKH